MELTIPPSVQLWLGSGNASDESVSFIPTHTKRAFPDGFLFVVVAALCQRFDEERAQGFDANMVQVDNRNERVVNPSVDVQVDLPELGVDANRLS